MAREHEKFHLVDAFVVSNNIDIFCISEAFLDSSVDNIYDGLNINGYTLVRRDHPSNTKRGGVAIYKDHLPVIRRNDISSLNENIVLEIRLANNISLPSYIDHLVKTSVNLMNFFQVLTCLFMSNINDEKPLTSIITGDFNVLKILLTAKGL